MSTHSSMGKAVTAGGKQFHVSICRRVVLPRTAPRLVAVSRIVNIQAFQIVKALVDATRRYTPEPHEFWIVDNCSPSNCRELISGLEGVNIIFNDTSPIPPEADSDPDPSQEKYGSYANAYGLELAAELVEPDVRYFMSLHMDTMPCRKGWLSLLTGKIDEGYSAVGVELHRGRTPEGVLHPQGLLLDFQRFRQLGLSFLPRLPRYDVGDLVSVNLRKAGDRLYAFRNTLWNPELVDAIPEHSPYKHIAVDRVFDDDGNIFFLHLGRGVIKAAGQYWKNGRMTVDGWANLADKVLAAGEEI